MSADDIDTQVCSQCGEEKVLAKFYKHPTTPSGRMAHCKACHNGCTATNHRWERVCREWMPGDPTEAYIRQECKRFQGEWTDKCRQRRRARATQLLAGDRR